MVRPDRTFLPNRTDNERYQRIVPVYDSITDHTDPLLERAMTIDHPGWG